MIDRERHHWKRWCKEAEAEVERLTAEAVPDGVVVIDGRRWRVLQLIDTSGDDVPYRPIDDVLYRLIPATEGTD